MFLQLVQLPHPLFFFLPSSRRCLCFSRSVGLPAATRSASLSTAIAWSDQLPPHWQTKEVVNAPGQSVQPGFVHGPRPACAWSETSCLHRQRRRKDPYRETREQFQNKQLQEQGLIVVSDGAPDSGGTDRRRTRSLGRGRRSTGHGGYRERSGDDRRSRRSLACNGCTRARARAPCRPR